MKWFKKKKINYIYVPSTWQGWLVTLLLVAVITFLANMFSLIDAGIREVILFLVSLYVVYLVVNMILQK